MSLEDIHIGFFITSHGFGHAARDCAIMNELQAYKSDVSLFIYTDVPKWFFSQSLNGQFNYRKLKNDVAVVQKDPMTEDLSKTIEALRGFYPIKEDILSATCEWLKKDRIDLVIADISPLGLLAGKVAGLKTILLENFTWDWIYEGYENHLPEFSFFSNYLKEIYQCANFHIAAKPVCEARTVDLVCEPIGRRPRMQRGDIREKLMITEKEKMVLVTMGGIAVNEAYMKNFKEIPDYRFVIPCAIASIRYIDNFILLPHHSIYYHPDLVNAADLVIGKTGYSTLAEVYIAGLPFFFFSRSQFRESGILKEFIQTHGFGKEITLDDLATKNFCEMLSLSDTMRPKLTPDTGNDQVVRFFIENL